MSSSDQSDYGIYESDEEITSFLYMHNSSSDETLDEKSDYKLRVADIKYSRRDSGRGSIDLPSKPKIRSSTPTPPSAPQSTGLTKPSIWIQDSSLPLPKLMAFSGERTSEERETGYKTFKKLFQCQMFEFGNDLPQDPFISTIKLRLLELMKQNEAVVYLSTSFMRDWTISQDVPPKVICDTCVFSDNLPVCLFTFYQCGEADEIHRYNAKITRHFVSKVRKVSHSNFTALGGVFDEADCKTEENFTSTKRKLESEARKKFVPNWLHMDGARCSQIVEIFLKMGLKCGKQWLDVSDSLNDLKETVTSTTKGFNINAKLKDAQCKEQMEINIKLGQMSLMRNEQTSFRLQSPR